ncbi:MAG: permease prefix domain 1-containing protein [Verrucomicrobiota bacterium]|jgi:hypothetical protein
MENQTRFDLNAAIESWRRELAAQPNLASDDRRELETHLRDAITGFQQRGLSDEESFWLARRRVGQPTQLGEEFVKADPTKIWRERAFWMVLMLSLIEFWFAIGNYLSTQIGSAIWYHHLPSPFQWLYDYSPPVFNFYQILLNYFPIVCLVFLLAQGRMNWVERAFQFVFRSRWQFVLAASVLVVVLDFHYDNSTVGEMTWPNAYWFLQYCVNFLFNQIAPLSCIALIAWLMPTQNRKTPKRT